MNESRRMLIPLTILTVIVVGALFETAAALGWRSIGALAGDGPAGEGIVLAASLFAMLAGAAVAAVFSGSQKRGSRVAWLLPIAAAAFLIARFYSFDPYYAPTLRRMSDGGVVSPFWVFGLVILSVVAGLLAQTRPREGFGLAAPAMILCGLTAWVAGAGH